MTSRKNPGWIALAAAVILAFLLPGNLNAQSIISGDIAGTVTDPAGAAVPNAAVTVTNGATGGSHSVTTNADGSYRVSLLKPGEYTVVVKATGFQQASVPVTVSLGTVASANVTLAVGSQTQTVQVTASAPILHTEAADLSTTFSMQQVQSLPNPGNDLTFVAQTAPGSVMNTQSGYGNFSSFGLPATANTFTMNGGYENDPFLNVNNSGATNLLLGNNDVSDVSVISNAYNAAYGGLGGAQINETTRSGSNKFHGNASYWWNGSSLNANDYFNNQTGTKKPFSNVNQWAAAIGGPIVKDKSFFFFNYEGLRIVLPTRSAVYAPSALYESTVLNNLTANGLSDEIPGYQKVFDFYNKAPGYASAIPSPTSTADNYTTVLFNATAGNFTHEWLMTGRVDQSLGANDHLFGHFEVDKGLQATYTNVLDPVFNADSPQPQYQGQLNETHTFSPNLTNQFLFAEIYYRAIFTNTSLNSAVSEVPFSLIFADGDLGNNGSSAWPGGLDIIWPQGRNVEGYQFSDDVNWFHGNHNIQFGWTIRRDDVTDFSPSEYTASPEAFDTNGSFQQGTVDFWFQQFPQRATQPVSLYAMGWYVQDQWKVRPNFTLTYGVRFEHDSNPICHTNCFSRLSTDFLASDPSPDTPYNKIILSGQHVAFNNLQKIGYEPRIGFAYIPAGVGAHTTIRGGFGMFADAFPGQIADSFLNNAPTNVPFSTGGEALMPVDPNSAEAAVTASNKAFTAGYSTGASLNSLNASVPGGFAPPNIVTAQRDIKYPTYEEWSLTVEHQLTKTAALSLGYVGNHTYHQPIQNNSINAYGFGNLPASAPNPNFSSATQIYSEGMSNYNGVVASFVNRAHFLTTQVNYVYSHALDDISNGGFDGFGLNSIYPSNPYNFSQNYGNSDYDTRHYISGSYLINVPYWGGPRAITDGWQISGTVFHNDGYPFSVYANGVASGIGNYCPGCSTEPLLAQQIAPISNNHCGGEAHANQINPNPCSFVADFADPTGFGQSRRNQIYGSSYTDTDLGVAKSFGIPGWEGAHLKIGAQAFNVLNHPNFQLANGNIDSGAVGTIASTVNTPTSILGSFLGGDASPRLLQLDAKFSF